MRERERRRLSRLACPTSSSTLAFTLDSAFSAPAASNRIHCSAAHSLLSPVVASRYFSLTLVPLSFKSSCESSRSRLWQAGRISIQSNYKLTDSYRARPRLLLAQALQCIRSAPDTDNKLQWKTRCTTGLKLACGSPRSQAPGSKRIHSVARNRLRATGLSSAWSVCARPASPTEGDNHLSGAVSVYSSHCPLQQKLSVQPPRVCSQAPGPSLGAVHAQALRPRATRSAPRTSRKICLLRRSPPPSCCLLSSPLLRRRSFSTHRKTRHAQRRDQEPHLTRSVGFFRVRQNLLTISLQKPTDVEKTKCQLHRSSRSVRPA